MVALENTVLLDDCPLFREEWGKGLREERKTWLKR
jgi:hypothetical protein